MISEGGILGIDWVEESTTAAAEEVVVEESAVGLCDIGKW